LETYKENIFFSSYIENGHVGERITIAIKHMSNSFLRLLIDGMHKCLPFDRCGDGQNKERKDPYTDRSMGRKQEKEVPSQVIIDGSSHLRVFSPCA
jgi:hypothetical protein